MGKILRIPVGHQSREEWVDERSTYLGGSDVGTIFGLSDYMSPVELFYQKLGEVSPGHDNRFSFMGRFFEEPIAELFKYWDGDNESILYNYPRGIKVREVRRTNFRYINEDFPWLSCNLDRFYKDNTTGERGLMDCKNMMDWVERKWETGIPPYHVMQVMTYMGVLGMKKAYIAVLVGGNRIECYPIDFNQNIFDGIVEKTKAFWDKLVEAREVIAATGYTGNKLVATLSYKGIEPSNEGSMAYEAFLKKRYEMEEGIRAGTEEQLQVAFAYQNLKERKKEMFKEEAEYRTKLMEAIGPASGLEWFGTDNKVTWLANKNGERTLRLNLEK